MTQSCFQQHFKLIKHLLMLPPKNRTFIILCDIYMDSVRYVKAMLLSPFHIKKNWPKRTLKSMSFKLSLTVMERKKYIIHKDLIYLYRPIIEKSFHKASYSILFHFIFYYWLQPTDRYNPQFEKYSLKRIVCPVPVELLSFCKSSLSSDSLCSFSLNKRGFNPVTNVMCMMGKTRDRKSLWFPGCVTVSTAHASPRSTKPIGQSTSCCS